jgi:hypothetical protein
MSNKILICSAILLISSGLAFVTGKEEAKTYVIPSSITSTSSDVKSPPIKAIYLEPPTSEKIKQDLAGKTIEINGELHSFLGSELNLCKIVDLKQFNEGLQIDVIICGDITIIDRRKPKDFVYSHEQISGTMKVYYDRAKGAFSYKKAESVNLKKTVTPNTVAPPSSVRVTRYVD